MKTPLHDEIRIPSGEYNRLSRLMTAYERLCSEVEDFTGRYGGVTRATGLSVALEEVNRRRREMSADIVSRNGMSDD